MVRIPAFHVGDPGSEHLFDIFLSYEVWMHFLCDGAANKSQSHAKTNGSDDAICGEMKYWKNTTNLKEKNNIV